MRDYNLLFHRHGYRPVDARKQEGTVAVAVEQSNTRWYSDGFEIGCDNDLPWDFQTNRNWPLELRGIRVFLALEKSYSLRIGHLQ